MAVIENRLDPEDPFTMYATVGTNPSQRDITIVEGYNNRLHDAHEKLTGLFMLLTEQVNRILYDDTELAPNADTPKPPGLLAITEERIATIENDIQKIQAIAERLREI